MNNAMYVKVKVVKRENWLLNILMGHVPWVQVIDM